MFPNPVPLPPDVALSRKERNRQIMRSAGIGVGLRGFIIALELLGVFIFGSSALLMDALASSADILMSLSLMFSIWMAQRPPDEDHPFGHGRYEPLVGMQLGLLLTLLGGVLLWHQLTALKGASSEVVSPYVWIFALLAVVVLEISYRIVMRSAKQNHSPALAADAAHYRIDSISSLIAVISLGAGALWPEWSGIFDHTGALFIAGFMILIGLVATRNNMHQIVDTVPEQYFFDLVQKAAKNVPGVFETEKIKIQQYGPDAHVNIDVEVDPQLTVDVAHEISQKVRAEIQQAWPSVRDVTVHIEPFYPGDH
jgi:cation diffusion facilitator family transporter